MQTVAVFEHQMTLRVFDTEFGVYGMKNIGSFQGGNQGPWFVKSGTV
jgi:hypothetical protein